MPVVPHNRPAKRLRLSRRFVAITASITASILVSALTTSTASAAAPYPGPGDPSTRVSISLPNPTKAPAPGAKVSAAANSYIICYASAYEPVSEAGFVYTSGEASCSEKPDLFSATLTVWAYYNGSYHQTATRTLTTPPNPEYGIYLGGGACGHGWIYHTELEVTGFHGNWDSAIANSPAKALC